MTKDKTTTRIIKPHKREINHFSFKTESFTGYQPQHEPANSADHKHPFKGRPE